MKMLHTSEKFKTFYTAYNIKGIEDDYALPHSHSGTCEIILSMTAGGHVIIKNKIFPLTKRGLYFINGLDVHHPAPMDKNDYLRSRIVISINFLKRIVEMMDMQKAYEKLFELEGGMYCLLMEEDFKKADGYLKKTFDCYDNENESEFKMADAIIAIAELMKLGYSYVETPDANANKAVDKALKYIEKNIRSNITIEDISNFCHLNKYYLCHLFKVVVGMTISKYIKVTRISITKKDLAHTNNTISQISVNTGFNSVSYFGRVFLEEEGITPSEYRKAMKEYNRTTIPESGLV